MINEYDWKRLRLELKATSQFVWSCYDQIKQISSKKEHVIMKKGKFPGL